VIMQAEVHDRLELPTAMPMGSRNSWEKVSNLQSANHPMLKRIQFLAQMGLTSLMVLFDFLSKRITPLRHRAHPAWMYTGENKTTQLERGHGSDLDSRVLDGMLSKLSVDLSSGNFINPSVPCMPICFNQAMRSQLLKDMPTLDNIDITTQQMGDQSCGVHIPEMNVTDGRRNADTTSSFGKEKEKIASSGSASKVSSRSASSGVEASPKEIAPLERKRRLVHSDGSAVGGPPLSGQQALKKAAAPQPDPKAVVLMVLGSGGGSGTSVMEAAAAATAVVVKKVVEATATKETAAAKKATEAATVKKAAKEAVAMEAAEATAVKKAAKEAAAREAA
jgi:hypothetical protein